MAAKITPAQARKLLAKREYQSRPIWDPAVALSKDGVPMWSYAAFIDETRDRAICTTRQAGKSSLAAVCLIDTALNKPRTESMFVGMTGEHAQQVLWPDLSRLLSEYQVPATLKEDCLAFDNGSVVHCMGLSTIGEARKLQGRRAPLMVIDEANDLAANIDEALAMLKPALARHQGRLMLMGIPAVAPIGAWYRATEGEDRHLYGQHRASILDNPFIPHAHLEMERERLRLGEDNPLFIRMWLGRFAYDPEALVYRYRQAEHSFTGNPPKCKYYVAGLDPAGVADREALILLGFGNGDGKIWHVDELVSEKGGVGSYSETAVNLGEWQETYRMVKVMYDYSGPQKSLQLQYQRDKHIMVWPVPPKDLDIEIPRVNDLLHSGRLMIQRNSKLEKDLLTTQWDSKARAAGRNKYSAANHPDVADALRAALQAVAAVDPDPVVAPQNDAEREYAELERLFTKPKEYRPTSRNVSPYSRRGK